MGYGYVPTQLDPYEEGNRESPPGLAASTPRKSSQVTTFGAGQESSQVTRQKGKPGMPCLAKAIGPQIVSTTARIEPVWKESVQCDRVLRPGAGSGTWCWHGLVNVSMFGHWPNDQAPPGTFIHRTWGGGQRKLPWKGKYSDATPYAAVMGGLSSGYS
ncbi:hypothetical protein CFIO01_11414 [Colletotrichum fioriniae PJ7]|uniref:Uncharacterized protein n=1 Tax=Colletotrichum fioriniae PJ7 TaxID=1445577 RepID=A0A010RIK6_9PEZI|nr:hypothetical protein CFIO01_11414 [Colletotrichum fioriniae PJ7]